MGRKYNLIIFGASGFTGKYVIETAKQTQDETSETFSWAIAGRSEEKLNATLAELKEETGKDFSSVEKVIANIKDDESLKAMARQCDVLVNCVGPYRFFGEQVIKACLAEGTHHVDISGEPQFLERMQLKYHKEAEEKGVYIVGACGFDSIPCDCGIVFLQQEFDGDVNSVETFLRSNPNGKPVTIHFGTWQSAIYGLAHAKELRPIRQELYPEKLPEAKHKLEKRNVLSYIDEIKGRILPFLGSDRSVVMRSQRYFYHVENKRPVQMQAYYKTKNMIQGLLTVIGAMVFGVLTQFSFGRYLLETFPKLFSFGLVTHEGPKREDMNALNFTFTIIGKGWSEKLTDPQDQHVEPPNKQMIVEVKGTNPGYGATCVCLLQSALVILKDKDKMPSKGGVYPPGAAFAKTSLIDRLNKNGVTFKVVEE